MVTKEWAAVHRKHHAKCETPKTRTARKWWGCAILLEGTTLSDRRGRRDSGQIRARHPDWMGATSTPSTVMGVALMMVIDLARSAFAGMAIWAVRWPDSSVAAGVINGPAITPDTEL
jgi:stearoyl-CoA desaturase (delta-9 desaturase)